MKITLTMKEWYRHGTLPVLAWAVVMLSAMPDGRSQSADDPELELSIPAEVATFDLEFPGGTAVEFAMVIREAHPDDGLNLVVPEGIGGIPIPPMSLEKVSLADLSEVLSIATVSSGHRARFRLVGANIWVLEANPLEEEEPRELAVFAVRAALEGREVEDLVALIERAFAVAGNEQIPEFYLHEDTNVLMASVTEGEAMMVMNLIGVLGPAEIDKDEQRKARRGALERELESLKSEFRKEGAQLAELESMLDNEGLDTEKRREVAMDIRILSREVDMIEREISTYMDRLSHLRAEELGFLSAPPVSTGPTRATTPRRSNVPTGTVRRSSRN